MRVTNFKTNGRIYAPRAGNKDDEILIDQMKTEFIKEGMKEVVKKEVNR